MQVSSRRLRLALRYALSYTSPLVVIPAGTSTGVSDSGVAITLQSPTQWFRLFGLVVQVFPDMPGVLSLLNPALILNFANPAIASVVGWSSMPAVVANPLINFGSTFGVFETPIFSQNDYAQALGAAITQVNLTLQADASNSDVVNRNIQFILAAVVEVYDRVD
jgi:hypothetical protein